MSIVLIVRGRVIGPTFQFSVPEIKFGLVSYSKLSVSVFLTHLWILNSRFSSCQWGCVVQHLWGAYDLPSESTRRGEDKTQWSFQDRVCHTTTQWHATSQHAEDNQGATLLHACLCFRMYMYDVHHTVIMSVLISISRAGIFIVNFTFMFLYWTSCVSGDLYTNVPQELLHVHSGRCWRSRERHIFSTCHCKVSSLSHVDRIPWMERGR